MRYDSFKAVKGNFLTTNQSKGMVEGLKLRIIRLEEKTVRCESRATKWKRHAVVSSVRASK